MSHDQSFKNLILDYPRQALAFFAEAEALDLPREVRITPIRQEQLQERLGERFRELDVPLIGGMARRRARRTSVRDRGGE